MITACAFAQEDETQGMLKVDKHSCTFQENPDSGTIFIIVDNMPEYPGGDVALLSYLSRNLKFPPNNGCWTGKIYATFVVNKIGEITAVRILRGLSDEWDEEVLSVLQSMPQWIPGSQRETCVRVQFNLPISINLR